MKNPKRNKHIYIYRSDNDASKFIIIIMTTEREVEESAFFLLQSENGDENEMSKENCCFV